MHTYIIVLCRSYLRDLSRQYISSNNTYIYTMLIYAFIYIYISLSYYNYKFYLSMLLYVYNIMLSI